MVMEDEDIVVDMVTQIVIPAIGQGTVVSDPITEGDGTNGLR